MVPTRHPTPWSNINVSLVTNRDTEELIEKLKNSLGTVEILNLGEKGRGRNISEIIVDRGEPLVFYDIWPKSKLEEWLKEEGWKNIDISAKCFATSNSYGTIPVKSSNCSMKPANTFTLPITLPLIHEQ